MEAINLGDFDLAWLAIDANGLVGVFLTAGEGPIPDSALPSVPGDPNLESQLQELPVTGSHRLFVDVPDPSSLVSLSNRGLFVFDWSDVHRPSAQASGVYELVCKPERPLVVQVLPANLQAAAVATSMDCSSFAHERRIAVHAGT